MAMSVKYIKICSPLTVMVLEWDKKNKSTKTKTPLTKKLVITDNPC